MTGKELVEMEKLQSHEKIQVGGRWFHVLGESNLDFPDHAHLKSFYRRELEVEDAFGTVCYLRVRHTEEWELERCVLIHGKWEPSCVAKIGEAVDISSYDEAVEKSEQDSDERDLEG